jgi:uncharacterized protein (DUF2236 family)
LVTWERVGRYLARPQRRINKPAEATDLIRQLESIRDYLQEFPPILGEAGQPGYLVLALAKQAAIVPTFQELTPAQRESLAQHWDDGRRLLLAHRTFLRQELEAIRHKSWLGRGFRELNGLVEDHPGAVLFILGLVALTVAIIYTVVERAQK